MNRSFIIAIVIAVLAVGWLATGVFRDEIAQAIEQPSGDGAAETQAAGEGDAGDDRAERATAALTAPAEDREIMRVQTEVFEARPHAMEIGVRGRTESVRTVDLRAEAEGKVVKLYKAKGETVKAGDPIARLSTEDREARRLEALALIEQREIEYNAAVKLAAKGYKSETSVATARALLDAARAAQKRVAVEIEQLTIRAPFDGVIAVRPVQLGAFLRIGDPVATIVDRDPILIVGNISEREVGLVEVGAPATARLVDGATVQGTVRFISPTADASTRTFRIEVEADNAERRIRDGVTAEIQLAAGEAPAHRLTPAILTLNDQGDVGVRTVDRERRVRFRPVEIIADDADGVWVAGLPQTAEIITVGQEYVREGQTVEVARAAGSQDQRP